MSAYLCDHCGLEPPDYIGAQCPRCGVEYVAAWVYEQLAAELRWCDAERRLALRALAEYTPECMQCDDEYAFGKIEGNDVRRAVWNVPLVNACDEHAPPNAKPLPYAAQIAAADEETGR